MKINIKQIKAKISCFIFDLIIESGSKSKFFRKYTNHRFRKQYERLKDDYFRQYKCNNALEKANSKQHERISDLNYRLHSIYDAVKVVATEYPKNISCPHGEKDEVNDCPVRIICGNENFEKGEDLEIKKKEE